MPFKYSWTWGLLWSTGLRTRVHALNRTDTRSHSSYQWPMFPQIGVRLCAHLPQTLAGILSSLSLSRVLYTCSYVHLPWVLFFNLFLLHVYDFYYMYETACICVHVLCAGSAFSGQKRALDPMGLELHSFQPPHSFWERIPGPLQEQSVLSITQPSL